MYKIPSTMPVRFYDDDQHALEVINQTTRLMNAFNRSYAGKATWKGLEPRAKVTVICSPGTWEKASLNALYDSRFSLAFMHENVSLNLRPGFVGMLMYSELLAEPAPPEALSPGFPTYSTKENPDTCCYLLPEEFMPVIGQLVASKVDTLKEPDEPIETYRTMPEHMVHEGGEYEEQTYNAKGGLNNLSTQRTEQPIATHRDEINHLIRFVKENF